MSNTPTIRARTQYLCREFPKRLKLGFRSFWVLTQAPCSSFIISNMQRSGEYQIRPLYLV